MKSFVYKIENLPDIVEKFYSELENSFLEKNFILIGLSGNLGAGKTTFTKELFKKFSVIENVMSPTFVLRKDYFGKINLQDLNLIHIDAYRLEKKEDIESILSNSEIFNFNNQNAFKTICFIEWAEMTNLNFDKVLNFEHISESERKLSF